MTLVAGTKLGPYEIQSPLGAGGMGEVYKARDTRLERTVAIKVLPEALARDDDRLRRFEQEAKSVAALNHPNILAVFDTGSYQGSPYMVCELLEGVTLREYMSENVIPQRRAVEYGSQIAEGLAAAHEKGIIHRDLKPENVFITRDGRVKILDFGLAKLARAESAAASLETRAGVTLTTPGVALGTAGYMSPEQVRGREVDARSDIFALGAIFYEMLSRQRAFHGDTSVETMNSILKDEPPELDTDKLHVAPGLERVIRRCLEKEPERRFHSARDVGFALEALSGSTKTSGHAALPALRRQRWPWIVSMLLVAFVAAVLGSLFAGRKGHEVPTGSRQLTYRDGYIRAARFAPDGKSIVYAAMWDGAPMQLYSGRLDSVQSQVLEPGKADLLSISHTGEMAIALDRRFMEPWVPTGVLARVPLMGGAPRSILNGVTDADWSPDGSGLAISRRVEGRFRLEYPAGKVLYETAGYISHLRFSPDGKYIAFMDHPLYGDDRGTVAMINMQGQKKTLTREYESEQGLAWTADGNEIWFTAGGNTINAISLGGRSRPIYSALGTIVLQDVNANGQALVTRHDPGGEVVPGTVGGKDGPNLTTYRWAIATAISGDGTLAVLDEFNAGSTLDYEIFVRRTDGTPATDLGPGAALDLTADGKWVLAILPSKPDHLILIPTGVGETRSLPSLGINYQNAIWFPDGRRALVVGSQPNREIRTYVQEIRDGGHLTPVTPEGTEGSVVSADGKRFLAHDRNGRWWIYDVNGGEPVEARGISSGETPVAWMNDGGLLVWLHGEMPANIHRVDLRTAERQLWKTFAPSQPAAVLTFHRIFVTRDGRHYLYDTRRVMSDLFVVEGLK